MAKTLAELRTLVLEPVDMQAEDFVDDTEVNRYINQGIKQAEAEIHNIYQDYFMSYETVPIVSGTKAYDLPEDIYADKIRQLHYKTDASKYIIKRIRDINKIPFIDDNQEYYNYMITNTIDTGPQIELFPTPTASNTTAITAWYIREAAVLASDSDELDIPEFYNFIVLYARHECLKKELGNPLIVMTKEELERERNLMINSLRNRIPDNDTELIKDLSFYDDYNDIFGYNGGNW